VYLRRLRIVQTPWWALYLHFILEPDYDRHPHDHPANFWTFILRGGYQEVLYRQVGGTPLVQTWRRWSLHKMSIRHAHQITLLTPGTRTLVLFGRRQKGWGFWTEHGVQGVQGMRLCLGQDCLAEYGPDEIEIIDPDGEAGGRWHYHVREPDHAASEDPEARAPDEGG
jgi:hypothetical protein